MRISIIRKSKKGEALDGYLSIDGIRICETSENALYAIPAGTYPVVRHLCKQHELYIPFIQTGGKLPECSGCPLLDEVYNETPMPCRCPQIAKGNGILRRTDGSIIVGTRIVAGCLMQSHIPFDIIRERLRKAASRGSDIVLTIKDEYL